MWFCSLVPWLVYYWRQLSIDLNANDVAEQYMSIKHKLMERTNITLRFLYKPM